MSNCFSVVTIVKNRTQQLANLINNLEAADAKPSELIIVWMTSPSDSSLIQSEHFDIQHRFATSEDLPIAQARNKGFMSCSHEYIFHLDVDCLCPPDFFADTLHHWQENRLYTAKVVQVESMQDDASYQQVKQADSQHIYDTQQAVPANTSFRSAVFAIRKTDFERVGGFDEQYHGFGIGDIDFVTRCDVAGLKLARLKTQVFTQYRSNYQYPINHLLDIVTNANVFKHKWGYYPATHWLAAFVKNGFVNKDYERKGLSILRMPTQDEIFAALNEHAEPDVPANAAQMTA